MDSVYLNRNLVSEIMTSRGHELRSVLQEGISKSALGLSLQLCKKVTWKHVRIVSVFFFFLFSVLNSPNIRKCFMFSQAETPAPKKDFTFHWFKPLSLKSQRPPPPLHPNLVDLHQRMFTWYFYVFCQHEDWVGRAKTWKPRVTLFGFIWRNFLVIEGNAGIVTVG